MSVDIQVQEYFVEIRVEVTVKFHSLKIQVEMVETQVEMTVEFHFVDTLIVTIVHVQLWRCHHGDGVKYLYV